MNTADANGQYQTPHDTIDDTDTLTDNTQSRINNRRKERSNGNSGYEHGDGFVASEDDVEDELGIEDDD